MIQILTATLIGLNGAEFFVSSNDFWGWLKCRSESGLIPYGEMCYTNQPSGVPPALRFFGMCVKLQRVFCHRHSLETSWHCEVNMMNMMSKTQKG